jgi:hypothetical protein
MPVHEILVTVLILEVSGVVHAGRLAKATPLKAIDKTIATATAKPINLVVVFISFLFHLLTFFISCFRAEIYIFPIGTVASSYFYFMLLYLKGPKDYKKE